MIPWSVGALSPWGRFFGLMFFFVAAQTLYLSVVNRDLLVRRMSFTRGTEKWDWVWSGVFKVVFLAIPATAALDVRSGVAPLPTWMEVSGIVLFLAGCALFLRAMGENPFFEGTVRIQSERGHRVIHTGPYRFVRHPGYVAIVVVLLSLPPILASARAFIPAGVAVAFVIVRTTLEDRTLRVKLVGYADYVTRVQYRLMPGVW